ncbi:MAG: hypothetical protein ACKOEM_04980, partial [Planctomycetia bacterium]
TTSNQVLSVEDLFPTLCAAAGVALPDESRCDGVDVWRALVADRVVDRPPLVIATSDRACVDGDWKLVVAADGTEELYHLPTDPGEARDRHADQPARAAALRAHLATVEAGFQPSRGVTRPPPPRRGPARPAPPRR